MLNQRGDISSQGPNIFISNCSCSTFLFDSFWSGMNIAPNPRDGIISKRPKLYIVSFKQKVFVGIGVQIRLNLRIEISSSGPKIFIFSSSFSTFLFDFFEHGVNISLNPRDGIFPKGTKLYILSFKRNAFGGSGV